jgi:hypothetical protein
LGNAALPKSMGAALIKESSAGNVAIAAAQSADAGSISVKWSPDSSFRLASPPAAVAAAT